MPRPQPDRRWSAKVTETSDALDLEDNIFTSHSAKRIAASLKHSAERSRRRKASPFQSAMSMLNLLHQSRWRKTCRHRKNKCSKPPRPSCAAGSAVGDALGGMNQLRADNVRPMGHGSS